MKILMKQFNAAVLVASMFLIASCGDSFLEVEPKRKLIAKKTNDYNLLLYSDDIWTLGAMDAQVIMGDEVVFLEAQYGAASARQQRLFRWDAEIYEVDEDANETLGLLKALYSTNIVINEVLGSEEGSELEKKSIHAEALTNRAWINFMFINYYGKPYNAETADTDPRFPIIKEADINRTSFPRESVAEVYELIVEDLTTAIPNLIYDGVNDRMRVSRAAAEGLLGKVYLFMNQPDLAIPYLEASLEHIKSSDLPTGLYDYNVAPPVRPLLNSFEDNILGRQFSNAYLSRFSNYGLMLSPEAYALYGEEDLRISAVFGITTTLDDGTVLYKKTNPSVGFIGVRVTDMYLLLAEAKARVGELAESVAILEDFRAHRMPAEAAEVPLTIAQDKQQLVQFIIEERIREFAMEGFRWFDMRRISVDPLFADQTYEHELYASSGDIAGTYELLVPERFTLRFPAKIRFENPDLVDNP